MKRGRPSTYTPEIAAEICARLAAGETLREICRTEGMPPHSTVAGWTEDAATAPGFGEQYARARSLGLEVMAEEILEIADDARNDWMERQTGDGHTVTVPDQELIARSRLRVDSRKWLLSKLRPEKYGDRTALELGGPGGSELKVTIRSVLDDEKPG